MRGWVYLIKNGDLYKIGITRKFENRMRQLKPDYVVAKLYSTHFMVLEKEFHKRYKKVRIPQTEYFRLDRTHIKEIKQRLKNFHYPISITFDIFVNSISYVLILFVLLLLFNSLSINDFNAILLRSLLWMKWVSFILSILSLFVKSNNYFSFFNEFKFRSSRFFILIIYAYIFRLSYGFLI